MVALFQLLLWFQASMVFCATSCCESARMASLALGDLYALYHKTIWIKPVEASKHIQQQGGRLWILWWSFGAHVCVSLCVCVSSCTCTILLIYLAKWGHFKKWGHFGPKWRLEFRRNIIINTEGYHDALTAHPSLSSSEHSGWKKMIFTINISEPCLNEVKLKKSKK